MKIGEFLKHSRQRVVMCLPDTSLAAVAKLMYEARCLSANSALA
jgi:hypothetical protein